ncbi:hypothetical protein BFL38_04010 [Brachyspira hampsonii]|uniref:Lipoprotein n=1 Tax=Brachyspira hampsonii TaxID=1287055 RepID=A0A1E5NCN4_9SPIR|nr:hypothetical protein [Brachyspira hampsonii]OEJ13912.1 hypothetical protein BFL38_04010 [Brachyspira hampsonii]
MRALSVISLLILISLFAVSCGEKKGTDPTNDTTSTTPNKGIQTYQGDWKVEGKDANQSSISGTMTIASDGTITGNVQGIIGEGQSITKDKITDKGNETYEINMSEYSMIYEFTFSSDNSGSFKIFVSLNGNKQESASGTLTRQ